MAEDTEKLWYDDSRDLDEGLIGLKREDGNAYQICYILPDWRKKYGKLMVASANACISINPSNPMAVAEGMEAVFETLKPILEMIECGLPVMGVPFDQFKQSLAKITGGK